jgi:hypothetical protein
MITFNLKTRLAYATFPLPRELPTNADTANAKLKGI